MRWRAGVVEPGALVALAFALAGCARESSLDANGQWGGNWQIEQGADRITGSSTWSATLVTRKVNYQTILFPPPVVMQLFCFKDGPAVYFKYKFRVGSNRNAEFSYRFDTKPGHVANARFVDDYRSVVIEDRDEINRFIGEMMQSHLLYLRTRALTGYTSDAEFVVDGAPAAVNAAFTGCPLNPPGKRTSLRGTSRRAG